MSNHSTDWLDVGRLRQAQAEDRESLAELMRQHDGLVHHIIRQQWGGALSYAETLQEGRIGLWRALLHFDPVQGTTFATYAGVVIAHQVWRAVRRQAAQEWEAATLCEVWGDDSASPTWCTHPLVGVIEGLVQAELEALVARLPRQQRYIVRAYYGLDGQAALTQAQLGQQLGCTRQAIHYHLRRALQRLRHPAFSAALRALLGLNRRQDYLQALQPERRRP
jgi:RNA polymerase sigma factor (sigma-70 family)